MNPKQLAEYLGKNKERLASMRAVTGFDGFVDEMITLVEERKDFDSYARVEDISRFAQLVEKAAGHSSLREIVVTAVHAGGCAVNMGDGLASMGIQVDTFATLGDPVHPAFSEYGQLANLHSWGREPGRTLAFEFADGKLMFSSVTQLAEFDSDLVRGYLKDGDFMDRCLEASLIALTDWSMYPHMTSVWELINKEVFSNLEDSPWLFIDLVDPSSRSEADINGMLESVKEFSRKVRVVLGLNKNEADIVSRLLGMAPGDDGDKDSVGKQAGEIRSSLELEQVVVHGHSYAVCSHACGISAVDGPYCANPRKSTGAGDRFNAGFALGLMLDLTPEECLLTGVASSGFFVREARSASSEELVTFIKNWHQGKLD